MIDDIHNYASVVVFLYLAFMWRTDGVYNIFTKVTLMVMFAFSSFVALDSLGYIKVGG